uniref:DNA-binding stress response protein n=1 Tax=Siphoviridae sp. ctYh54 TaxID=2826379 RepID=A0A8S5ME27_9CAUD|nr:MAG TPA: DNA-binding stress response protein [Siphoviridae sp. ctYh54]
MLMNNGQNTRSYSPVPTEMSGQRTSPQEEPKEKLRELVSKQIAHEIISALTLTDLASSYCKMGLEGHKHKLYHKASKEFKENFDWRKYYYDLFEEAPKVEIEYESKELPKSIDDIYNRIYDLHMKDKENIHAMLKLVSENHMYEDMKLLLDAYQKCEQHEAELGAKMRRAQLFGYDVAYILCEDDKLHHEHKEYLKRKHKENEEHYLK